MKFFTKKRMPFFSVLMPRTFQKKHPAEMKNLRLNSKKLTTPFDIHETLLHILNFQKPINKTNIQKMSRGISLFKNISPNRTCENAQIEPHWCSCLNWIDLKIKKANNLISLEIDTEKSSINNEFNRLLELNIENKNSIKASYHKEYEKIKKSYYRYTKSALILAFRAIEYMNGLIDESLKIFCEKLHLLSIEKISQLNLNQKLLLFKESKDIHGREAIFHDLSTNVSNTSSFSLLNTIISTNRMNDEFLSPYFNYRPNSSNNFIKSYNNELNSFVDTEITFQITLNTWPGNGSFEMSLKYNMKNSQFIFNKNEISRINNYYNTSNCINKIRPVN